MKTRNGICLVLPFFVFSSVIWISSGEISKYCANWKSNGNQLKAPECHGADEWNRVTGACIKGPNFCMCNETDDNPIRGKKAKEYCDFLLLDNWDSWKYPYRGRDQNVRLFASSPEKLEEELQQQYNGVCVSFMMCLAFGPAGRNKYTDAMFRTSPFYPWRGMYGNDVDPELLTNRLLFTNAAIAQEGLSFCIIGRHLKRSPLSMSTSLKGFLPFLEKGFDIGNHIDPYDSTKMNHFILPEEHKALLVNLKPKATWDNEFLPTHKAYLKEERLPRHEYENVIMGYRRYTGWNFQSPNPDVPLVDGFIKRPAHPDYQPHYSCRNPYFVKVTTIEADGKRLHNYLHIKVYSDQIRDPDEKRCPTGKMKYLMLEVRDEYGYPVGQFTDDIPCEKDDETLEVQRLRSGEEGFVMKTYAANKDNVVPCMYSHPKATVHPTILLVSAVNSDGTGDAGDVLPGEQGPDLGEGSQGSESSSSGSADFCRNSSTHPKDRKPVNFVYKTNNDNYFTEVHATWRYAQMNNGWVKELHFATLIIEDERPIQYYTSRRTSWTGPDTKSGVPCHAFGTMKQEFLQNNLYLKASNFRCNINDTSEYDDEHACNYWQIALEYWSHVMIYQMGLLNRCSAPNDTTNRPYGYSAQYSVLYPTQKTLGGWDYFQKGFVPPEDVNCHVDITPGEFYNLNYGENGHFPLRASLTDYLDHTYRLVKTKRYNEDKFEAYRKNRYYDCWGANGDFDRRYERTVYELSDWHTPGHSLNTDPNPFKQHLHFHYFGLTPESPMKKMFRSAHQDPVVLKTEFPDDPPTDYFGSEYLLSSRAEPENEPANLQGPFPDDMDQKFGMEEMSEKSRCPCPYIITTPPPELQTKTALEIEGRKLHVINTLFAWMVLVPLAFFVARFYKETFTKVFFFQEFWWYTIHVLALWTALLFTAGGIYALHVKRDGKYEIVWTDATAVHVYTSYVLLGVYIIHLISGPFRLYDTEWRMIQIALHWGIGWLEYCLGIVVILSATAIPSGIMNCTAFGVFCGFILFQVGMTLGMELHMRKVVDPELQLDPPREYMPPPMMRIFHRDAPHSKCRIVMLVIFALGCCTFYAMMHVFLALDGGETGCFQPQAEKPKSQSIV